MDDCFNDRYFYWLANRVKLADYYSDSSYIFLGHQLHLIPFNWEISMDENRALEAISLRTESLFEGAISNDDIVTFPRVPSVFEVLVALAIRWESYISYDPQKGDQVPSHFFEMISNLNLLSACDAVYNSEIEEMVNIVITDFLNRHYNYDGTGGGLFPITKPRPINSPIRDQRTLELWLQLNDYVAPEYL